MFRSRFSYYDIPKHNRPPKTRPLRSISISQLRKCTCFGVLACDMVSQVLWKYGSSFLTRRFSADQEMNTMNTKLEESARPLVIVKGVIWDHFTFWCRPRNQILSLFRGLFMVFPGRIRPPPPCIFLAACMVPTSYKVIMLELGCTCTILLCRLCSLILKLFWE